MARMTAIPLEDEIFYPESDGEPMAETEPHLEEMVYVWESLKDHFAAEPDVFVGANLFLYYRKGDPAAVVAPDGFVVKGVPKLLPGNRRRRMLAVPRDRQSRRSASDHPLGRLRLLRGTFQAAQRVAAVIERLGLLLPGRRARADAGGNLAGGHSRSLRRRVLAPVPGARRLPDAHGLGSREAECRLFQRQAVAADPGGRLPWTDTCAGPACADA